MAEADLINGKALSKEVRAGVERQVAALANEHDIQPGLAIVLVGEDPASQVYVRNKLKQTGNVGMQSFEHRLSDNTTQEELLSLLDQLNRDARVNGILVQLPLPDQISNTAVLAAIDPDKDVDGFHIINTGRLWEGTDGLVPCTPLGCRMLIKQALGDDLSGQHAVIVGRSNIVGKPIASLLLRENCTVTIAHSRTRDLAAVCRSADILVAGVGRPNMVRGSWLKSGATVIDVGINRETDETTGKDRLIGDVSFDEAREVAGAITPVPGGVGPMTIACLLQNTVTAACLQHSVAVP